MQQDLYFKIPQSPAPENSLNTILLDTHCGSEMIGTIVQTKRNLPDGATADRFYFASLSGVEVPETDAYTLPACLRKVEATLKAFA